MKVCVRYYDTQGGQHGASIERLSDGHWWTPASGSWQPTVSGASIPLTLQTGILAGFHSGDIPLEFYPLPGPYMVYISDLSTSTAPRALAAYSFRIMPNMLYTLVLVPDGTLIL